ncbi:hypothetical protein Cgig2_014327 [Carnegiea gigantea]|uniref:Uncharacterized protein n=1 Tax=Carnegiea gigantea TaxID=171969 RepID=A0A9Q1JJF3_9CARY|nr:hypothetical protein Cgig2_014327 [Carnegiea gigantea]
MVPPRRKAPKKIRWIVLSLPSLSPRNNWGRRQNKSNQLNVSLSLFGDSSTSQRQDIPPVSASSEPSPSKGGTPYRAEMPGELSKLNRPYEKLKTASLAPILSRLLMHPRVREASGTRSKRNPLALVTRKQEAPRKEFCCCLNKRPRNDDERIRHFHTTPCDILMEIKGSPILRCPKPIDAQRNSGIRTTLYELADRGQLNRFLKKGGGGDHNRRNPEGKKDNDTDRNTKVIATIIGGIDGKELNAGY